MAEKYTGGGGVGEEQKPAPFDAPAAAAEVETDGGFRLLNPKFRSVEADGITVVIKPWTLGQIATVTDLLIELGISFSSLGMDFGRLTREDAFVLASFVARRADVAWKIIAFTLSRDVSWVENLDGAEGVDVIAAMIEVNKGFFRRLQEIIPAPPQGIEDQTNKTSTTAETEQPPPKEAEMTGSTSSANS